MTNLLLSLILLNANAATQVSRIQAMRFDRSTVSQLYLAPGLGSVVLFPCNLIEVFVGRSDDLKAQISPNDKKTLLLNLKLNTSLPTNLIARCEGDRSPFVFDVFPSRQRHQDVVEIRGSFGSPGYSKSNFKEVHPNTEKRTKIVISKPVMTEGGTK